MTNWDDRRYGDEYGPADYPNNSGRSAYREYDPYTAYDAVMSYQTVPYLEVPYLVANIPVGYGSGYPAGYGVSSFGELSVNSKVTPLTTQMAVHLGFDPNLANSSVAHRDGALLVDSVIYIALTTALTVLGNTVGSSGSGMMALLLSLFLSPDGLYLYRVAGDSIFDGSPGRHAIGMKTEGAHGTLVPAHDGFVRNTWILPPMIPAAGWFVSAGLTGQIVMDAPRDPLGRGRRELSVRMRAVGKPGTRELQRGQRHMGDRMGSKEPQSKQLKRARRIKRGKQSDQGERDRTET